MQTLDAVIAQTGQFILGKERPIRLALACLLARGHLLIEDIPGVGKTLLAHVLAQSLGLRFSRIQFTSDLLPADILGSSVYERDSGSFRFHPGPIFAQLVLADEVNRATPKSQSALLEVMEEHQVTIEGVSRPLDEPFFVIATQNPSDQIGTFPLPESQLDRFLMVLELGYPDRLAEREMLIGSDRREMLKRLEPVITPEALQQTQQQVQQVHASAALIDYLQALIAFSRETPELIGGLSPRASLGLLGTARAWALLEGRSAVLPEDLQAVLPHVVRHRLPPSGREGRLTVEAIDALFRQVAIP